MPKDIMDDDTLGPTVLVAGALLVARAVSGQPVTPADVPGAVDVAEALLAEIAGRAAAAAADTAAARAATGGG